MNAAPDSYLPTLAIQPPTTRTVSWALGTFTAGTSLYPGAARQITVSGRGGTVEITDNAISKWELRGEEHGGQSAAGGDVPITSGGGHNDPLALGTVALQANIQAFVDSVRDASVPLGLSGREHRKALAVVQAIYESARNEGAPAPVQ
jgi:hypothetical protein